MIRGSRRTGRTSYRCPPAGRRRAGSPAGRPGWQTPRSGRGSTVPPTPRSRPGRRSATPRARRPSPRTNGEPRGRAHRRLQSVFPCPPGPRNVNNQSHGSCWSFIGVIGATCNPPSGSRRAAFCGSGSCLGKPLGAPESGRHRRDELRPPRRALLSRKLEVPDDRPRCAQPCRVCGGGQNGCGHASRDSRGGRLVEDAHKLAKCPRQIRDVTRDERTDDQIDGVIGERQVRAVSLVELAVGQSATPSSYPPANARSSALPSRPSRWASGCWWNTGALFLKSEPSTPGEATSLDAREPLRSHPHSLSRSDA